jgi:hypothetical protein
MKRPAAHERRLISNAMQLVSTFHNSGLTNDSILDRAMCLIQEFTQDATLRRYRSLLETEDELLVSSADAAIEAMRKASLTSFNPFLTSGFKPDEDEFSDVLAELFNPHLEHGFGYSMIEALLNIVADKASEPDLRTNVTNIKTALQRSDPASIRIRRNYWHKDGKPDIVILGTDPSAEFIVLIENKKPYGKETVTHKGVQTTNYSKIMSELSAKMKVEDSRTLAIFLTPTGSKATDRSFVALSTSELSNSMLRALDAGEIGDVKCRHLTRAWLLTYDWLNGGVP